VGRADGHGQKIYTGSATNSAASSGTVTT
jgi:hypothetical protein